MYNKGILTISFMGYYTHEGTLHRAPPKCTLNTSNATYHDSPPDGNYDKCNICFGGSTSF